MKVTKILLSLLVVISGLAIGYSTLSGYVIWTENGFSKPPVPVDLYYEFTSSEKEAILKACNTWNSTKLGKLVYITDRIHSNTKYPYKNDRNELTRGNRGNNGYAMRTTKVSYSEVWGELYEVDIDINNKYNFSISNTVNPNSVDYQSCITHELGHLLGLGDLTNNNDYHSAMYYKISLGDIERRTLSADDIAGIIDVYTK
jgi:predicted Zn-dependent protease